MHQLKRSLGALLLLVGTQIDSVFARESNCVTNSSGVETCAARIFRPSSLCELQNAVNTAIQDHKKVRAIGGLHSAISDVKVGDNNYLIDTSSLDKILEINLQQGTVKAEAGVNLHTLSLALAKVGLQLVDQPGAFDITVAGMVANGAHESGLHGCISDSVTAIELVDGLGNFRVISNNSNPEWLPAARVSLGLLGVIYSVTFQCYPTSIRNVIADVTTANRPFMRSIPIKLENNENFQFLLNPYSKKVLKQTFNSVDHPCTNNTLRNFGRYLAQSQIVGELNTILNPTISVSDYPMINNMLIESGVTNVREFFYKGYSFFHDNTASRARLVEIAVNADKVVQALNVLFDLVKTYHDDGFDFITMAEVRYAQDSQFTLLSPTRSDHPSWLIALILIYPFQTEAATNLLRDLSNALKQSPFDGRPSWGNNPEFLKYNDTKNLYGADNVAAFNDVRRLLDPNGIFYTQYFKRRLGPQ